MNHSGGTAQIQPLRSRTAACLAAAAAGAFAGLAALAPLSAGSDPASLREEVSGIEFVFVAGGTYLRGDAAGRGLEVERPAHPVKVSDFRIGRKEVSVEQFRRFVAATGYRTEAEQRGWVLEINPAMQTWERRSGISWHDPGFPLEDEAPVVWVTWNDAARFVSWLAEKTGKPYRLPTEAEWEYAAREGGHDLAWAGTNHEGDLEQYAWYEANSGGLPHQTGSRKPNALGIHDLSGNVWEWCEDWQDDYRSQERPLEDHSGPASGKFKVLRGGSWRVPANVTRTTYRNGYRPDYAHGSIGFRVALPAVKGHMATR